MFIRKAPAKVNIFLKITGHKNGFHTLLSRFVQISHLYDTVSFIPSKGEGFRIEGCQNVTLTSNTVYKAYRALLSAVANTKDLKAFFHQYKVVIHKRIPTGAGLGGGSSNAAAFLHLANDACRLNLDIATLARLGATVGADVPFFVYDYPSANVSGFGEIIEPFDETPPELTVHTPPIHCDTAAVYQTFKTRFLPSIDTKTFQGWEKEKSTHLLQKINDATRLNDLYVAAMILYPELTETKEAKEGWFFSGSGSSFFTINAAT